MKVFKVKNIEWDTNGKRVKLPSEAIVECEDEEQIANTLSDIHGWLIYDFEVVSVEEL